MSKEVEPPKEVVESKQTNSKRKADVVENMLVLPIKKS